MERTYRYDRSGLVRDGYTVSTRHIGASNREWRVNSAALNRNRVMKRRTRPVFCRLIFVVMFIVCVLVAAIIIVLVNRMIPLYVLPGCRERNATALPSLGPLCGQVARSTVWETVTSTPRALLSVCMPPTPQRSM